MKIFKFFKKISALILALMMISTLNIAVFAEETVEETTEEFYEVTLSPQNYAAINFDISGYKSHSNTRPIEAYYNTRYPTDDYLLAEYFSIIASYNVPIKNALESINMNWYIRASGLQSGRTIPVFYDLNKFAPNIENNSYEKDTDGYNTIKNYALNYWPASGYSYSSTPFASQLVMNILESGNKTYTFDITETVMNKYVAENCSSEYITLATGRETSAYSNSSFSMKSDSHMPSITVKYRTADILSHVNTATTDSIEDVIDDIGVIGVLSESTASYSEFKTLGADFKKIVGETIFEKMPEGGFTSFSEITTAFSEAMNLDNMILTFINGANEENIASVMKNIGEAGAFSASTNGYDAYNSLSAATKKEVNKNMLSLIPEGGFTAVSDVATAFDSAMVLKTVTFTISPKNYATLYIAQDGYYPTTNPLNLHYNRVYSSTSYINALHMSIISSFEVPFRNCLTNVKVSYNFTPGNNTSTGRVMPFFYDLNKFEIDAEAGVYDNTTEEYANALTYAQNYWPGADTDGYDYSKSKFNFAYKFNDTTASGMSRRTLDITDNVLSSLKASENDYITISTGRVNSTYMNYQFQMGAVSKIPTLTLTYPEADLLNAVNTASVDNITDILDDLANAGAFSSTQSGAELYLGLTPSGKKEIGTNLLSLRPQNGFESISDLHTSWDSSMTLEEITTEISPNNYAVAYVITTPGSSYGYGSYHDKNPGGTYAARTGGDLMKTYVNKWEMSDFTRKKYANLYSTKTITEFNIPLKQTLSGIKMNYNVIAVQNSNKAGFDVHFNTAKISLNTAPAVYSSTYDTTAADGSTVTVTSDTNEQFKSWYDYAISTDWQAGPQNNQAGFVKGSVAFNEEIDLTSYALKNFKASSSDYLSVRAGGASIYDGWRLTKIPTIKLSYTSASVLDYINGTTDASVLLDNLGISGLLNASISGYNGYKGLDAAGKQSVSASILSDITNGGFESYADFIAAYDKAVEAYVNSIISNPLVNITFDDSTVTNTGTNSEIKPAFNGTPQYVTGANGTKALYITNTFGKEAQNYLDLGEYKFNEESFSIVFWLRAVNAGIGEFGHDADSSASCSGIVDFTKNNYKLGGVVLSNKDFAINDNTGFAFTAMPQSADFGVNMKIGEKEVCNTVGIDAPSESRWHQIAYIVDRDGNAVTYVDNIEVSSFNISTSEGSIDFDNAHLVFGADGLGQYGMISGEFDDIKIYPFALGSNKLEEMYYEKMLDKVNYEAESLLDTASKNSIYSDENKSLLEAELSESKEFASSYNYGNSSALIEKYTSFNNYYDEFLNKDSKGVALFTSDIHISSRGTSEGNGLWMVKSLNQHTDLGLNLKTWITAGDYAETGNNHQHYFFDILDANIPKDLNAVIARGNHDEPANGERTDEAGNKFSLSRDELREEFQTRTNPYFDSSDGINKSVLSEDGNLNEPYYYLNDGIAHYLVVDNYDTVTTRWISPEQFVWLEKTLNAISGDGKPIFIIQHLPITGSVGGSNGGYYLYKEYGDKLVALLNKYENDNIFLLNGHTHNGFGGATNTVVDFGNFYQINTTSFGKGSTEGFSGQGVAQYINVYDDRIVFRARDFKNDEWLRDYDLTFMLKAASKISMQRIEISDSSTIYSTLTEAAGKNVKISVQVEFPTGDVPTGDIPTGDVPTGDVPTGDVPTDVIPTSKISTSNIASDSENHTAILAEYAGDKLVSVKSTDILSTAKEIEFNTTLSSDVTEIKIMIYNTLTDIKPLCYSRQRQ